MEAEDDVLSFACFFAAEGFGYYCDWWAALMARDDSGAALKTSVCSDGTHLFLVIEFGEDGVHAVAAQAAGVNRAGYKARTEGVHFRERTDFSGVAEIVGVGAAREGWAACGFDGHDVVVGFATEFLAHERGDDAAQIGAAAGAADDDVGFDAVFVEGCFGLEADD